MPIGALGSTIPLTAQYQDGTGTAVNPVTPLVSILNPLGVEVVSPTTPTALPSVGRFSYDFDIPSGGLVGTWTVIWSGVINGSAVESTEVFTVVEAGSITFGPDCDTPMWGSVDEFIALHEEVTIDNNDAIDALVEATWLLSGLINDRYHQAECWVDHYAYRSGLCKIELDHQPVDAVLSVKKYNPHDGTYADVEGWSALPGGYVRICCRNNSMWIKDGWDSNPCVDCNDSTVVVQYRTKNNLPPGCARQVYKLAWEFYKSAQGKACALPERVTSVSREGVSWTILDPLDFLDKGLTGVGSVDQWISRVNMKGWAGLIDPLTRPRLLLSELTGCGPSCTGTE